MRLRLILGMNKSITLQHLEEELYQVVAEEGCHIEAKVEDMVMKTNVGWVIYKDKYCALPRYRIPSQAVKHIEDSRIDFFWIQESRTGRSSRYWDNDKQEYVEYEDVCDWDGEEE